jgi:hypothetical protein
MLVVVVVVMVTREVAIVVTEKVPGVDMVMLPVARSTPLPLL